MGLIDEVIHFITNGSLGGLPPLVVIFLPFIIGLTVGFFAIKFLKLALIVILVLAVVIFFGLYSVNIPALEQYGSSALAYVAILVGLLPLSIGFIIGAIVSFILD
jgi:hypothetical protein